MDKLFLLKMLVLQLLLVVFYAALVAQVVHLFFILVQKSQKQSALSVAYEVALLLHILLMTALSYTALDNSVGLSVLVWFGALPLTPLMWVHVAASALGIAVIVREKRFTLMVEPLILMLSIPLIANLLDTYYPLVFMVDAAYFLAREAVLLVFDARSFRTTPTQMSLVEAVRMLPEGILYFTGSGKTILMNDSMRVSLAALGLPTDLADGRTLKARLQEQVLAQGNPASSASLSLELSNGQMRHFAFDEIKLGKETCTQITAIDITEEYRLNTELIKTNALLETASEELRRSMKHLQNAEEEEARLRMRQRLHDVLGQKLSLLQQGTATSNPSREQLAELSVLLSSLLDELGHAKEPKPADLLEGIVAAFALVGVRVEVMGVLPLSGAVSEVCVNIIREAVTNAVRHAQAQEVQVLIQQSETRVELAVSNDCRAVPEPPVEGCGITGMRNAVESLEGTLIVDGGPPFTIRASISTDKREAPPIH